MSGLSKKYWRYPTWTAQESLAERFGIFIHLSMQDWEHRASDPNRIDEFWAAYESGELTDDEKFVLMEMIIASFECLAHKEPLTENSIWQAVQHTLDENIDLHISSVWDWSDWPGPLEEFDPECNVSLDMRNILEKHRARFAILVDEN